MTQVLHLESPVCITESLVVVLAEVHLHKSSFYSERVAIPRPLGLVARLSVASCAAQGWNKTDAALSRFGAPGLAGWW